MGATENEMVGQHHQLNGDELEQTPGDSEGQGGLVCCSRKESDTTWRLNSNNNGDSTIYPPKQDTFEVKRKPFN